MAECWSIEDARDLYGIHRWGADYFDLNEEGDVVVNLPGEGDPEAVVLKELIENLRDRGRSLPLILRFRNLLDSRIEALNSSFRRAAEKHGYQGAYRGVYPIKVNQQQQVLEEITACGCRYHFGLEVGSRPELLAALAYMHDPEALLICNGYKDEAFIDLALQATRMGLQIILVVEMPGELPLIINRAEALGIRPHLGVRFRLSTKSEGLWAGSGGDRSTFGLNATQLVDAVDLLKENNYLDCLRLFHYHQGSQLPNIRAIREAVLEAVRVYVALAGEGAPMGLLDLGGGLAIDYDGSHTNSPSSCNYRMDEYAGTLVEVVKESCEHAGLPHPTLITESGRAVVAPCSVLVFNILDVACFSHPERPEAPDPDNHEVIHKLAEVCERAGTGQPQECYNEALFYRDQVRALFNHGQVSLRERALAERTFWHISTVLATEIRELPYVPEELEQLEDQLTDFYYGNFSVFQSLPDHWAIDHLFPVMPLHRHLEEPTRRAILADLTCDSDGRIDRFADRETVRHHLPVHPKEPGEAYLIGVFLTGAYQETLGDLHNLLGDPNVVSVGLEDGKPTVTHEVRGDSVADVLSYVEYEPGKLEARFLHFADQAVARGEITAAQRTEAIAAFQSSLEGYTYFEG